MKLNAWRKNGTGRGNRTLVFSLEGCCITTMLYRLIFLFTKKWWAGEDSNLRSHRQQIYSLPRLATSVPTHTVLILSAHILYKKISTQVRSRALSVYHNSKINHKPNSTRNICWCPLTDSNCRPTVYKTVALPTELRRRKNSANYVSSRTFVPRILLWTKALSDTGPAKSRSPTVWGRGLL